MRVTICKYATTTASDEDVQQAFVECVRLRGPKVPPPCMQATGSVRYAPFHLE